MLFRSILLRDIDKLKRLTFKLGIFDEIQNIKNSETLSYQAAGEISAEMKVGLTGTPIENSVREFKTLMDIVLPGYLGTDDEFDRRYVNPVEQENSIRSKRELRRLTFPFTLRRMKTTVLHELPEKIEDIRTCELSDEQVRLYRDAIESRQNKIMDNLCNSKAQIPYMHIFALLTLLKQICDHPAIVEKQPENFESRASGKWDLFKIGRASCRERVCHRV